MKKLTPLRLKEPRRWDETIPGLMSKDKLRALLAKDRAQASISPVGGVAATRSLGSNSSKRKARKTKAGESAWK